MRCRTALFAAALIGTNVAANDTTARVAAGGDEVLRDVLTHAQAGQFNARSWAYWHYRLGLAEIDQVPPLPLRRFG